MITASVRKELTLFYAYGVFRSSHSEVLCKKDVLKSLFGHFVEACNFIKKENLTSQIFKNTFFY